MSIISAGGAVVGAGSVAAYQIERSLRFNSADSAYLNRTPGSASNRDTWTFSGWVKRSKLGMSNAIVFGSGDTYVNFETDRLAVNLRAAATNYLGISTAKFRDTSAWYHIVVAVDTTQATAANRLKMWVNNQLITAFDVSSYLDIPVNTDTAVNSTNAHNIGRYTGGGEHFDGYLTEINFIDGQALTPTSFGQTNASTGVWEPKKYAGTYGTNGFYLNFSDNASTTTLGDDLSGNGNDWTTNNFSVTAGAGNDSLVDSPTSYGTDTGVGGEVRGNYCTLNPLNVGGGTLSNGNLDWTISSNTGLLALGTMAFDIADTNNKYYWEFVKTSGDCTFGIGPITLRGSDTGRAGSYSYYASGDKYAGVTASAYGASFANNDVIGVAVGAGKITFYKNGVSQGDAFTGLTGFFVPMIAEVTVTANANFGQRPFAYTAPSGFKALCTQNLPTPTIGATSTTLADDYFNTVLYTGNGSSRSITGVGFQPDFVWIKKRSGAESHVLSDAIRGTNNFLSSDSTAAENTASGTLTAFNSDGFSLGTQGIVNDNTFTFVAWNWKAGGTGVTNTAGTITSTVSASTTSGFSVVTYTGTGSAATIGHGLGAVPRMIIVKNRDQTDAWQVYHAANTANPETDYLVLNTTAATADAADRWNDTLPTSTLFSIGNGVEVNTNTEKYVAYCFAPVAGYSAFGSYTGNGSTDGTFVYTGFRPRFIMLKNTTTGGNSWHMIDTVRGTYNVYGPSLDANAITAEITYTICDVLSNGFKFRDTNQAWNQSNDVYVYMAFAENPFKYALAR